MVQWFIKTERMEEMEYKLVVSSNPHELQEKINNLLNEGWEVIGSHHVVTTHSQNRYSGNQHMDIRHSIEYSQTMIKKT